MKVSICIITYKRPVSLKKLLSGLKNLVFILCQEPNVEVIVIDNDQDGSSEVICSEIAVDMKWPVKVFVEPRRGIPFARNLAIASASHDCDFLAFIDDDEIPEPQWLDELLYIQKGTDADAVMGPVVPIYSNDIPQWVLDGKFHLFNPINQHKDGSAIEYVSTNNVLVRFEMINNLNLRFNEEMALTGGTDTLFFMTAKKHGSVFVWANNAIVTETFPASRASLKWILLRSFRLGNTLSICDLHLNYSPRKIMIRILKGVYRIILGSALLPMSLIKGKVGFVQATQNISRGLGTLAGVMNIRYNEYKNIHGE